MTWHATENSTENDKMQHPVDGKAWKNFDTRYPDFAAEKGKVRLGLAANGFNSCSDQYSKRLVKVGYLVRSPRNEESDMIHQRYIDKDPSLTNELYALAGGPSPNLILVNSCIVVGVRFVIHNDDKRRTTQNNGICSPDEKDEEMYYDDVPQDLVDSVDEVLANTDDDDEAATVWEAKKLPGEAVEMEEGRGTMLRLGPIAVWWSNFVGKLVREFPMYYPLWYAIEKPMGLTSWDGSRTRQITEIIHVDFDELIAMASKQSSLEPALHKMTPTTISLGLVPNPPPSTPFVPPSRTDWDLLFQLLFDKLLTPPLNVDFPSPQFIAPITEVVALEPTASTVITKNTNFRNDPLHESLHDVLTSQGSSSNMRQPHTLFESVGR
nr:hypothetical protein [Tanacetum cinerariifolium]